MILDLNREGTTVVFSTHQMETAEKLCRDIALIDRGRLVLSGALAAVKQRFRIGILMYGKRPTIPEVLRWVRT